VGARSRKRRRITTGDAAFAPREVPARPAERPAAGRGGRLRGEAANEAVRADLEPLAPGERPAAVTLAVVLAVAFGVANLVLLAAGYDIRGNESANAGGAIVFAAVMFAAAWGMWAGRYWAVLGFECLLAIVCVSAALALLVASNVAAVVLCVVILGLCGALFWKLIRAMARMRMPQRPGA
jgi:MFS family permease